MTNKKSNLKEKFFTAIRPLWMLIRKLTPKGAYIKLNDYRVKDLSLRKIDRLFDRTRNKIDDPAYEAGCITAMHKYVRPGDKVTIVGGGYGITGVAASEKGAEVTVIEAGEFQIKQIRDTWKRYGLNGKLIHGFVGSPISIWGSLGNAIRIEKLPPSDVLELDCEGSEKEILSEHVIDARIVIVESHGHLGSPSQLVENLLKNQGYKIIERMEERPEKDIIILVGEKK